MKLTDDILINRGFEFFLNKNGEKIFTKEFTNSKNAILTFVIGYSEEENCYWYGLENPRLIDWIPLNEIKDFDELENIWFWITKTIL